MTDITDRVRKAILREADAQLQAIVRLESKARRAKSVKEARATMRRARAAADRYNDLVRELSAWSKNMLELDGDRDARTPPTS